MDSTIIIGTNILRPCVIVIRDTSELIAPLVIDVMKLSYLCKYIKDNFLSIFVALCPKGDDPLTVNQNYRQIQLSIHTHVSSGEIGLEYAGQTSYLSLSNPGNCGKYTYTLHTVRT